MSDPSHTWTQTIKPAITPQPPIPYISANGMKGSISISQYTPVNVTISLNPGGFTNTLSDVWVAAYLNGIWYYYFYNTAVNPPAWQWTTQARPSAQGGLVTLSPYSVFSGTVPAGTSIAFCFAVDLTMDGVFDSPYYYVTITGY